MHQSERVTVGITCYNARDTIGKAIRSAQSQDWPDLEILIVDDASTDGSAEYVASLTADDPRIRLISHRENGGAAKARNTIIEAATGDFIVFFDDDDESAAKRVMLQVAAIKSFEASNGSRAVACYAAGERIYPNGHLKPLPAIGSTGTTPCGKDVADYLLFYRRRPDYFYGSGTPTCALMARRELFLKLGGFDASLKRVEDIDFAIRLALAGGCFIGTAEKLFLQHSTQGSDKSPDANRTAEIAVAKKHQGYLRSIGKYHYASHWPNLRYHHFKRQYFRFVVQFLLISTRNPILATSHLLATGPKRLRHERRMNKRNIQ
ncbi:glycosyltransferase family 2 protein [Rhizobium lentis]|uniref:glycosyltransferase family 2 protein n=1 Tax=Rhizobium TaxID=379 RepID=UPI001620A93E|nr:MULTISPECIES: glycosyltransferase family A protein [Rhizobium]MBB3353306.1 glycosyltransferase involved in cell wall biosynthesis [Rhizobium sp. BK049]MBX5137178.1 glycosyltransferase family 2 protein [Rhizobium lentis]MBX5155432.1 glycosyltransferase family 2 protein [Rhizobium lentis]